MFSIYIYIYIYIYFVLGHFGNCHPVQAKQQSLSMHNSCCFSRTDALHVPQRVAPKSETSGLIKCTLGNIGKYRNHLENKQRNEQKLGTSADKALSCLGDLPGPMSTLGDIGSYKCHVEMNLETAGNE